MHIHVHAVLSYKKSCIPAHEYDNVHTYYMQVTITCVDSALYTRGERQPIYPLSSKFHRIGVFHDSVGVACTYICEN